MADTVEELSLQKSKMGLIYKATSPNGKVYIGQTTQGIDLRKKRHLKESSKSYGKEYNIKFHNAIRKYGFDNFKWEIIEDGIPQQLLDMKECEWIQMYNSYRNGYNSTLGGNTTAGYRHSVDSKKKMSEKRKGLYVGSNNPFYGKCHTQQTKEKISKARTGKRNSPNTEFKCGMISQNKGKHLSESTKLKLSKIHKDKKISSGSRNPMSYESIMKRYNCNLEKAKEIRKSFWSKETL